MFHSPSEQETSDEFPLLQYGALGWWTGVLFGLGMPEEAVYAVRIDVGRGAQRDRTRRPGVRGETVATRGQGQSMLTATEVVLGALTDADASYANTADAIVAALEHHGHIRPLETRQ